MPARKRHTAMPPRTPAYLSRATLAAELDIAESTVDEMVKRGVLPNPVHLSAGCVRWSWASVQAALASLGTGSDTPDTDPFLAGVKNVTKISEGRRRGSS